MKNERKKKKTRIKQKSEKKERTYFPYCEQEEQLFDQIVRPLPQFFSLPPEKNYLFSVFLLNRGKEKEKRKRREREKKEQRRIKL